MNTNPEFEIVEDKTVEVLTSPTRSNCRSAIWTSSAAVHGIVVFA